MSDIVRDSAEIALVDCLGLKRQEQLLVLCDESGLTNAQQFLQAGKKRCKEVVLVQIESRKQSGNEIPDSMVEWIGQFDVAVLCTEQSLYHTEARRKASTRGTRVAVAGTDVEILNRILNQDWRKVGNFTRKIAGQLSAASKVHVTSPSGTDLRFETGGRAACGDDGRLTFKGAHGTLPPGKVSVAPLEGTAKGKVVFDVSFALCQGLLEKSLVLEICEGRVLHANGNSCTRDLEKLFVKYRSASRSLAEFGVGTLESAVFSGDVFIDEKVKGAVHCAIGDNSSIGGDVSVPLHLDGVMKDASVTLNDIIWIKDGMFV